ncbi:MAG: PcfB family protein [Oscillospiraceae bacterium]|jgi:hypothetical protein|nr:PcfB family protein [Oscillospiraceae bacterium]
MVFRGTKLTAQMFKKAALKLLTEMRRQKQKGKTPKTYQGKQSVKNLIRQGGGASNAELTNEQIKDFERVARKYGVDYAIKKDSSVTPPKWVVFFKGRDSDVIMSALADYTKKNVKKQDKPSLKQGLEKALEQVTAPVDPVRNKRREGPEL